MAEDLKINDPVKVFIDPKLGKDQGWFSGKIIAIDPYSKHRGFYWVELDDHAQALLGIKQISVLNPKNIQKISS